VGKCNAPCDLVCIGCGVGTGSAIDDALLSRSRSHAPPLFACLSLSISLRWQAYARADLDVVSAAHLAAIDQEAASNVRRQFFHRRRLSPVSSLSSMSSKPPMRSCVIYFVKPSMSSTSRMSSMRSSRLDVPTLAQPPVRRGKYT
jgi:hypothetical protein